MEQLGKIGKVALAGAGPGDAGLLTLRTAKLIEQADVIVYDALVSAEILCRIPKNTRTVNVGKTAGNHPVPQEEINEILVREAKAGRHVLRLKGGDPFVFGRGGEEAEALIREGIPFEVVPGVTSAAAVPACAGIPLTHRDYTSSFHVVTGHAKRDGNLDIDFDALVKLQGTLVFLMGVSTMPALLLGLREAGMELDMPAVVIERGSLSGQRRISGTISTLADRAREAAVKAPAILIVGRVCDLAEQFCRGMARPLDGRQILVTRPRERSAKLAELLREEGAHVLELPAISTRPIIKDSGWWETLLRPCEGEGQKWFVFTSPAGVNYFFEQMMGQKLDLRDIFLNGGRVQIATIGPATEKELWERGLRADLVPNVYSTRALGEALAREATPDSRMVLLRAKEGSAELSEILKGAGFQVEDVALYETVCETDSFLKEKLLTLLKEGEVDAVTFTSASTVRGFAETFPKLDYSSVLGVCIGKQTEAEAKKYGIRTVVSKEASMTSMVEAVRDVLMPQIPL